MFPCVPQNSHDIVCHIFKLLNNFPQSNPNSPYLKFQIFYFFKIEAYMSTKWMGIFTKCWNPGVRIALVRNFVSSWWSWDLQASRLEAIFQVLLPESQSSKWWNSRFSLCIDEERCRNGWPHNLNLYLWKETKSCISHKKLAGSLWSKPLRFAAFEQMGHDRL